MLRLPSSSIKVCLLGGCDIIMCVPANEVHPNKMNKLRDIFVIKVLPVLHRDTFLQRKNVESIYTVAPATVSVEQSLQNKQNSELRQIYQDFKTFTQLFCFVWSTTKGIWRVLQRTTSLSCTENSRRTVFWTRI